MQIVIDINEQVIDWIRKDGDIPQNYHKEFQQAFIDGIILSKEHGRLIDADALICIARESEKQYARWERKGVGNIRPTCSNCGIYNNSKYKNFCPNCGRNMKGKPNDSN